MNSDVGVGMLSTTKPPIEEAPSSDSSTASSSVLSTSDVSVICSRSGWDARLGRLDAFLTREEAVRSARGAGLRIAAVKREISCCFEPVMGRLRA